MKVLKVREYRKINGYNQEHLAQLLGIKQGSYSRKENGKRKFTFDELEKLKEIFKVTYDDLLN